VNSDRLAVNHRTALKMFWDAGYDTEQALLRANATLQTMAQPSPGYYYADAVSLKITELKGV
jgi:hypothetical protein